VREHHPQAFDAVHGELRARRGRGLVARVVAIKREQHPARLRGAQRVEQFLRQRLRAVARGHVGEARAVERERVDDAFGQDDLRRAQRRRIPHAALWPGQKQMPLVLFHVADRAAVDRADHRPVFDRARRERRDREHDAPAQVFVPGLAQDPQRGEARAQRRARHALVVGQPQPERAIDEPDLEARQRFFVRDPAFREVGERGRVFLQPRVVVVDDLAHQRRVVGVERERIVELGHGGFLHRRPRARRRRQRRRARIERGLQKLEGVPPGHAVKLLDELDHVAGRLARDTAPQALSRRHVQARVFVRLRMEGAMTDQVAALAREFDAARAHDGREVGLAFDPLDLVFRDHSHRGAFRCGGWSSAKSIEFVIL
jgi:hypothetical protein